MESALNEISQGNISKKDVMKEAVCLALETLKQKKDYGLETENFTQKVVH